MQMRITRSSPGKWAEYESAYKAIVSKIGAVPGLKARWLARDSAEPDSGYSVSVWESEQALRNYEKSSQLNDVVTPALQQFFAGEYTSSHCVVVDTEMIAGNDAHRRR
jgi:heme-degrading monooxygenase HmoA